MMAKPVQNADGQPPRSRQLDLAMFWKEYDSIKPTAQNTIAEEEDEFLNGNFQFSTSKFNVENFESF